MADFEKLASKIELFGRLTPREIELIAAQSSVKSFFEGEILFYEEDEAPYWYFVAEGSLRAYKVDKSEHTVSLCSIEIGSPVNDIRLKHDGIGYEALMFATIEGVKKGRLVGIKSSSLPLLFAQIPALPSICLNAALMSVERYQRAFYSGMILDGAGKVAFFLANDTTRFKLMKKQEIAAMLNIQPETLSRILGKLARKGVIELNPDIKVVDMDGLKEFYE